MNLDRILSTGLANIFHFYDTKICYNSTIQTLKGYVKFVQQQWGQCFWVCLWRNYPPYGWVKCG